MKFIQLKDAIEQIKIMISNSTLVPVIGAGFSCGCEARNGEVPNATKMKGDMINMIVEVNSNSKDVLTSKSFQEISRYYNKMVPDNIRKKYLKDNFTDVILPQTYISFLNLPWRYIYTLNIDDAIEKNSKYVTIEPNRSLVSNAIIDNKILYKLHGDVKSMCFYKDGENLSIFNTEQYLLSLKKNVDMLKQLEQDYMDKNLIFLGCNLKEELDILATYSNIKEKEIKTNAERFYVARKELNQYDIMDLENFGITTVIEVTDLEELFSAIVTIKSDIEIIQNSSLLSYKNIPVKKLEATDDKNKEYILNGKKPLDKNGGVIYLPYFFLKGI